MTDNIIEPDTFNGNTPKDQPDGIKARERLILEAARLLANALGITKNKGHHHSASHPGRRTA